MYIYNIPDLIGGVSTNKVNPIQRILGLGSSRDSIIKRYEGLGSNNHSKGISMTSSVILNPVAISFIGGDHHQCVDHLKTMKNTNGFGMDIRGIEISTSDAVTSKLDPLATTFIFNERSVFDKGHFQTMYRAFILVLVSCIAIFVLASTKEPASYCAPRFVWNNSLPLILTPKSKNTSNTGIESIYMAPNFTNSSTESSPSRVNEEVDIYNATPTHGNPSTPPLLTLSHSNSTPIHANPSTPNLPALSTDNISRLGRNPNAIPYVSTRHLDISRQETDNDQDSPYSILQNLRLKCIDKIIIGHLNINSVRNKIHLLADLIRDKIDIMLISETKLDCTFPESQFALQGYAPPYRLDRTANGGGLLLYLRNDIPTKPLPLIAGNIECIINDVTISKKKWLLVGIYNPTKSLITNHLSVLGKNLDHYLSLFENVIVFGDFNSEIEEEPMSDFCSIYNLKSLIKIPTCFKNDKNPSCIDLILTNKPHSFQNSTVLETGLSDFHKLTVVVMKTSFRKKPPQVIRYRNYKRYSSVNFHIELNAHLAGIDLNEISNDDYVSLVMEMLNKHAPLKMKYIRANDQPFITKKLRKEHMKRSKLRNKYLKNKKSNARSYKVQRNKCVSLLKEAKKAYFEALQPSQVCDNKKFWKIVNPLFTEKALSTDNITLIENNEIVSDDKAVAEIFNNFFSNAVKNLNIDYYEHFSFDKYFLYKDSENMDVILNAIEKYENHPSILKIKESIPEGECFSFKKTDLKSVIKEIGNLNETKSSPIESIPAKILKDTYDIIAPKIVIDFNSSVTTGIFPNNQKLADVTPVFKNDVKQNKGNYRPVSILPA